MANNLTVTISAVDKATATVKRINASMNRAVAPVRDIQRIGSEIAKNPVVDSLRRMGGAVGTVAKSLGIVSGSIAGITAIGVVAGVAEMTAQWARLGREIGNTSTSLGTTTKGLVTMRGAASMVGLSAENMDASLESVRQTMQDARWGRNQPLVALMTRLGMSFRYTKDGSIDAIASLKDISDAMAAQSDVGAKHTIAQAFGVEGLFPLLIKGRKAIEEYQDTAEKLGAVPNDAAIKRAEKFAESMSKLKLTMDGMKSQVGDSLISASQSSVDWLNRFTTKKRHPWADAIVHEFGRLFGDDPNEDLPAYNAEPAVKNPTPVVQQPIGTRDNSPLNSQPTQNSAIPPTGEAGNAALAKDPKTGASVRGGNNTAAGTTAPLGAGANNMLNRPPKGKDAGAPTERGRTYPATGKDAVAGVKAPLGIRSNNPLNLQPNGKEAVYPTMEAGIAAAIKNLMGSIYFGGGNDTVAGIVNRWAPANAPGNSPLKTRNYIAAVQSEVGAGHLNPGDPQTLAKLLSAMIRQENGAGSYDAAKMDSAIQHVLIEFKNAPPGTVATARSVGGKSMPVRIVQTMRTDVGGP